MVIYFSGTGNSEFVAKSLAQNLNEECVTFNELIKKNKYKLEFNKAENLILIFPIHAWQPPKFILEYLEKVEIKGEPMISAIATCGGEAGQAMRVLRTTLGKKNLRLRNFASVSMPDNYVVMFDVENESEINRKVENCKDFIKTITEYLNQGNSFQTVNKGSFPLTKTYVVGTIFKKLYMSSKPFEDPRILPGGPGIEYNVDDGMGNTVNGKLKSGSSGPAWGLDYITKQALKDDIAQFKTNYQDLPDEVPEVKGYTGWDRMRCDMGAGR
ncbi:MAG: EFR1 family ferrodoxin [Clostridia bacterium]